MVRKRIEQLLGNLLPVIYHLRKAGWFVFRPITLGVRVIVVDDDKVLLVRNHGRGQWHLPGGAVNRNETLIAAARREAYEETGSTIEIERLQGMYYCNEEYKSDHIAIFVARATSAPGLRLNLEIGETRFFPLSQLPPHTQGNVHRRLQEYHMGATGIYGAW